MATLISLLQNILDEANPNLPIETKRILLKETLQVYVLDYLYNHSIYSRLRFYGGTCLHVVYNLNRLSEDIDLDNSLFVDLSSLSHDLKDWFTSHFGYADLEIKFQSSPSKISRYTLKLPVLYSLGLSSHPSEALHIKIEISHHPQIATTQKTPLFRHGKSFVAYHFSLETMMANKILACLERRFERGRNRTGIKGRDYYDLWWFMQQGVKPLEEKLLKEGTEPYTLKTAMIALQEKVASLPISVLAEDLLPLFENRRYIENWLEVFQDEFSRLAESYIK